MAMNPNDHGDDGASVTTSGAGHPLGCGRTVEQVWADLEAGRTRPHETGCEHCRTARASLEQLAEATRALIDDPVEPPPRLLDTIMAAVRADLAPGDPIPLPGPPGVSLDISRHALAAVLRFAVDGVPGIRAHRCRIQPAGTEPAGTEPAVSTAQPVRVWMSVSLRYGTDQARAVDEARRRVADALSARIGLTLDGLDIELTDVWPDTSPTEGWT